jgi:RNA polymerase sigma-70 factor, ECF subfamily
MSSPGEITRLLTEIQGGNRRAETKLIPLVYDQLRRIAAQYMQQERPNHTLQATALVHEAYFRLLRQRDVGWQSRAHFFAIAARLMRRILVDYARAHNRQKRGAERQRVSLDEASIFPTERFKELLQVDAALSRLELEHPRQSQVVELKFFGGLSVEDIAEALHVSPKTVKRDWSVARVWLYREINKGKGA